MNEPEPVRKPLEIKMTTIDEGKGVLPAVIAVVALAMGVSWLMVYL